MHPRHFKPMPEMPAQKRHIQIDVTPEEHAEIKREAQAYHVTIKAFVKQAIRYAIQWMRPNEPSKKGST